MKTLELNGVPLNLGYVVKCNEALFINVRPGHKPKKKIFRNILLS
jgi:hypothetical protein